MDILIHWREIKMMTLTNSQQCYEIKNKIVMKKTCFKHLLLACIKHGVYNRKTTLTTVHITCNWQCNEIHIATL